jgi:hypothetical protein
MFVIVNEGNHLSTVNLSPVPLKKKKKGTLYKYSLKHRFPTPFMKLAKQRLVKKKVSGEGGITYRMMMMVYCNNCILNSLFPKGPTDYNPSFRFPPEDENISSLLKVVV